MNDPTAPGIAPTTAPAALPALHPLFGRMVAETGATVLHEAASLDDWASQPGAAMVVFAEDPERFKETLDLAVIVPELHAGCRGAFRVALLPPAASRLLAPRYGFARWPAFVMLRDGQYLGAVDGIRDWDDYVAELTRLLAAAPSRPPSIGIPVRAADADTSASCH
jgi:hydrogenase-1 operon protein HyaE